MKLTKFGHSCIALSVPGRRLVIDPGTYTPEDVLDGADAVLVTHEHADHLDVARIESALAADPRLELWTNAAVAGRIGAPAGRVRIVADGERFTAAGFAVETVGTWHEVVHPDIPRAANTGFVVEERVLHPGDAFVVPRLPIDTLCVPVHAPWSKTGEIIDWIRAVGPRRTVAIHDAMLSEVGLGLLDRLLGAGGPGTGASHVRLASGESIDLD